MMQVGECRVQLPLKTKLCGAKLKPFESKAFCFIHECELTTISSCPVCFFCCHTVKTPKMRITAADGGPSVLCILPCFSAVLVRLASIVLPCHFVCISNLLSFFVKHQNFENVMCFIIGFTIVITSLWPYLEKVWFTSMRFFLHMYHEVNWLRYARIYLFIYF